MYHLIYISSESEDWEIFPYGNFPVNRNDENVAQALLCEVLFLKAMLYLEVTSCKIGPLGCCMGTSRELY